VIMSSDTQFSELTRHPILRVVELRDKSLPLHAEGLPKVAQAVASALDIEDMGLVQQPIKDCRREYRGGPAK